MDEDTDPIVGGVSVITNRGILIMMAAVAAISTVAGFAIGGAKFGIGVIFGVGLAFINYLWLERSTRAMMGGDTSMATTPILAMKYFLRYIAVLAMLVLIFWTNVLPVTAVILGLSAFALAVVAHGIKSIFVRS
jgi:hypothetical protein